MAKAKSKPTNTADRSELITQWEAAVEADFNAAFEEFDRQRERFGKSSTEKLPNDACLRAGFAVAQSLARGPVPRKMRRLVPAVFEFAKSLKTIVSNKEVKQVRLDILWGRWEDVRNIRNRNDMVVNRQFIPLESLQTLKDQGVSSAQCVGIYGLCPPGTPATEWGRWAHLVDAELREHGSAVDWSKWRDPREVAAEEDDRRAMKDQANCGVDLSLIVGELEQLLAGAADDDDETVGHAEALTLCGVEGYVKEDE